MLIIFGPQNSYDKESEKMSHKLKNIFTSIQNIQGTTKINDINKNK